METNTNSAPAQGKLSKRKKTQLYIFAAFFVLYEATTYAANDMIMPGMLEIVNKFNVGLNYVASSLSIFILGNTIIQLFIGPASDRYGKRVVLLTGNVCFVIFTILIIFTGSIGQFLACRFLQGSCIGFVAIGYAMIHENFEDKSAVKLIALMGNVTIMAPLIGPVIGGLIIHTAGWHAVFIVLAVTALISLSGLIKYAPKKKNTIEKIDVKSLIKSYLLILKERMFLLGAASICLTTIPIMGWIGLAPVLIMDFAKLGFKEYIIFQIIALGGLMLSSVIMQVIAGAHSFFRIMTTGNVMFVVGIFWSFVFSWNPLLVAIGFFIYSFGLGLYNGMVWRILISDMKHSKSMTISLMVFLQTIAMAGGVEIVNLICGKFGFSFFVFSLPNLLCMIIGSVLIYFFAKMNKNRKWKEASS
ncbi:MAG: MFS transporter [Lentisphaerota bacterium]